MDAAARRSRSRRGWALAARGQSMVEFALVLPIFLTLIFGTLELGRVVFIKAQMENAVREGLRLAVIESSCADATSEARTIIKTQPFLTDLTNNEIPVDCPAEWDSGDSVMVSATKSTRVIGADLIGVGLDVTLHASATGRIE